MLKEEDRLAAVISKIEEEALVVPRGAFVQQPTGEIVRNRLFEGIYQNCIDKTQSQCTQIIYKLKGLPVNESAKFCNYFHFRDPQLNEEKSPSFKANLDKAIDFLDPIDEDQPKGCWSLQFERGSSLVLLRSLKWPGSSFFHVPETNSFGCVYFGIGEENKDIAFMIQTFFFN